MTVLFACGNKREHCPAAKKEALAALDQATREATAAQEAAAKQAEEANPLNLETFINRFDEHITKSEAELDCQALGKETARGLVPAQTAIDKLVHAADGAPATVVAAVKPIEALSTDKRGVAGGPNPGIPAWCASMREAIGKLKQDLPPLWATARTELQAKHDASRAQATAAAEKVRQLAAFRASVDSTGPLLTRPQKDELPARTYDMLTAYSSACR